MADLNRTPDDIISLFSRSKTYSTFHLTLKRYYLVMLSMLTNLDMQALLQMKKKLTETSTLQGIGKMFLPDIRSQK